MSAQEIVEKIEHAAHSPNGTTGRKIGITMALLGVLLAFCAAMVGAERTELIRSTVEQSDKWGIYQAEAMKFRITESSYEVLRALTPKADEVAKIDSTLRSKRSPSGHEDSEDTAELKDLIASAVYDLADVVTPDASEKDRFAKLAARYEHDMREAREDAEAYSEAIEAHHFASEWYERAQLLAEIGIVTASVALLLSNRLVWLISVVLGISSLGTVGFTFTHATRALHEAEAKIAEAVKRTGAIEADDDDAPAPPASAANPGAKKLPGSPEHEAPPGRDAPKPNEHHP